MSWIATGSTVRFHHVVSAIKRHDIDEARILLEQLEANYPLDEDVWMWKAGVARSPQEAVSALEKVLTLNPKNDRALRTLSLVRIYGPEEGQLPFKGVAVPFSCKVCGLKHWRAFQTCRACGCLWDVDNLNGMINNHKAIEHYLRQVVEALEKRRTPDSAVAAAFGRLNLGEMEQALAQFQRATELRPNDPRFPQWVARLSSCRTILAVDDCRTVLQAITSVLSKHGFTVRTALGGMHALTLLERIRPEAVLLVIRMPDIDGYDTCRAIRRRKTASKVPVIMMSASLMDRLRGRLAGANAYLPKPFDTRDLLNALSPFAPSKR